MNFEIQIQETSKDFATMYYFVLIIIRWSEAVLHRMTY